MFHGSVKSFECKDGAMCSTWTRGPQRNQQLDPAPFPPKHLMTNVSTSLENGCQLQLKLSCQVSQLFWLCKKNFCTIITYPSNCFFMQRMGISMSIPEGFVTSRKCVVDLDTRRDNKGSILHIRDFVLRRIGDEQAAEQSRN